MWSEQSFKELQDFLDKEIHFLESEESWWKQNNSKKFIYSELKTELRVENIFI
jgi:hypothetical protein